MKSSLRSLDFIQWSVGSLKKFNRGINMIPALFLVKKGIHFWLHWVFGAACRLSLVVVSRRYSKSQCTRFLLCWPLTWEHRLYLGTRASAVTARALEQRLSSCGHGDSRSEPVESPWARAGILNYLTTRSPPRSPFRNIIGGSV